LETVMEGKTGEFFFSQSEESLLQSLKTFIKKEYSSRHCRANAERFSKKVFVKDFKKQVNSLLLGN